MSEPLLELRDVSVRPSGRTILDVPRLELEPQATMAVLGPNGAGKSTLLRVAGALIEPTTGEVRLDGRPVTRATLRSVTAAVLQRPVLRRGTVRSNVQTGMRFHRIPKVEMRARTEHWLERLGIAGLADRQAHSLSGGEAQRVSLARALAVEPRLLLLDEPFSALDAPTRGELLADLRDALDATGTAALMVTHDRDEAAALSDAIAILHDGQLRQRGPAADVLDHPADRDCARTLGFDTILEPALADRWLGPGAGVTAVRAADLEVVEDDDPRASLEGRLRRVVPLGPSARVALEIDGQVVQASAPMPVPDWLADRRHGEPVAVHLHPERARPLGARAGPGIPARR